MSVNSIYKLLDKLEMMILKGGPIPFSPLVIVNHEKLIDTLDKIRASIPGEIQEAHSILRKSEEIQLEAQRRVGMLLSDAKEQAETILSESELLRAVQAEADKIKGEVISEVEATRARAKEEAEQLRMSAMDETVQIREGADKYAESILSKLDNDLGEMHSIVLNGQKHLAEVKAESIAAMTANQPEQQSHEQLQPQQNKQLSYKIQK